MPKHTLRLPACIRGMPATVQNLSENWRCWWLFATSAVNLLMKVVEMVSEYPFVLFFSP